MKLFTVSDKTTDRIVYGSAKYPMWRSGEPDIYVTEVEYSDEEFRKIRGEADGWRIDFDSYREDDHGYDQQSFHSETSCRSIQDEEILVKDGSFFGIIAFVNRSSYSKSCSFIKRYEYVSILTAAQKHGLWKYHSGRSSDNSSSSVDTVYYLHPLSKEE